MSEIGEKVPADSTLANGTIRVNDPDVPNIPLLPSELVIPAANGADPHVFILGTQWQALDDLLADVLDEFV